jgi:hypothetical protein
VFEIELRMRALLRAHVVEFARRVSLPCAPFPWLVIQDKHTPNGLRLCEVIWCTDEGRFICRTDDDVDSVCDFGDDLPALTKLYESQGWRVHDQGPIVRVFGLPKPGLPFNSAADFNDREKLA